MRLTHAVLAGGLVFAACSGKDDSGTTDTDTADTDTDTDADSDADSDTDTDSDADTDPTTPTLYDQLGGDAGVDAVLASFIGHVGADTRINWFFADTDLVVLQQMLHDQICEAAGGGCVYTGGDMATVHATMGITDGQFGALVEELLLGLDDNGVAYTAPDFSGGLPADQLMLVLASMQPDIVTDPAGDQVYFNQLGGFDAVSAVIDGLLANVAADPRINARFANSDLVALRANLIDQVCEATGGACTYQGKDMYAAHDGMHITDPEFDALVEDLLRALDTLGVPYSPTLDGSQIADALLVVLAGMRSDIVGH
ncbi:MAG: group 1 truncated hemoglobin [Myxococcota bacterium]